MKYAIIAIFLSFSAMASEPTCSEDVSSVVKKGQIEINTETPKHLKGATITIRQADGKETTVPAETFKIVPRKQQFITTATEVIKTSNCSSPPTKTTKNNRVSLLVGHGAKSGLNSSMVGSTTEIESRVGLIVGAQYQRMLNDTLSIGVQGQTNKTGSLLIGIDF